MNNCNHLMLNPNNHHNIKKLSNIRAMRTRKVWNKNIVKFNGIIYLYPLLLLLILILLLSDFSYNFKRTIFVLANHDTQQNSMEPKSSSPFHRCSHIPPISEQVTYIPLSDNNFTVIDDDNEDDTLIEPIDNHNDNSESNRRIKMNTNNSILVLNTTESLLNNNDRSKRHTNHKHRKSNNLISYPTDSIWNYLKSRNHNSLPRSKLNRDDLIPMKIHIHYDDSVYLLGKDKYIIIHEHVMPNVVGFFENVLSIRKEHKIDTIIINRRCPNNTVYTAKLENSNETIPYCIDHCEENTECGELYVPKEHLSPCSYCNLFTKRCHTRNSGHIRGVPGAQLIIYLSAKQTEKCKRDQTIAYAAHCAQDSITDRPIAGHANLCPANIGTEPKDIKALIATVKHEFTHVLGFSISLFAYYRDEFGNPLTSRDSRTGHIPKDKALGYPKWSDKVIKTIVRKDWVTGNGTHDKEIKMIITPTVVEEVRKYFNCSTLEGAELEDQGSDGTSLTHWEKRLFENEAMTGTHTQNSIYSRITLALLQDTGWYISNFSRAEQLDWGRNLGCQFAKHSCRSWIDKRRAEGKNIKPFCDQPKGEILSIGCTEDRAAKAICNLKRYDEPLPNIYQNFKYLDGIKDNELPQYGGGVDLADYCPFIQEFAWHNQKLISSGSRCSEASGDRESDRNAALEFYGIRSKCFEHGDRWEQRTCLYKRNWHHYGSGCYDYICTNNHFRIIVNNHSYPCYYPNQVIRVEQFTNHWLYNGTIICPKCESLCPQHNCRTYDKRLIDSILNEILTIEGKSQKHIRKEVEERILFYEILSHLESANETYDNNIPLNTSLIMQEYFSYRDHILELIAQHEEPPKEYLKCSSGGLANNVTSGWMLKIVSLLVLLVSFFNYEHQTIRVR